MALNELWNMKYDENFHNKCYCLFTQFTFKLNCINTVKEASMNSGTEIW